MSDVQAIRIGAPATLDSLHADTLPDPGAPGPGHIRVRLAASSLNYHDFAVVKGMLPAAAGRIPMSDGAGEVVAVGDGVHSLAAGDAVVSTFFTDWDSGRPRRARSPPSPATGSTAMRGPTWSCRRTGSPARRRAIRTPKPPR
jgi:NADPH:quinone reductase-like Zn-dependent oxidoreductase